MPDTTLIEPLAGSGVVGLEATLTVSLRVAAAFAAGATLPSTPTTRLSPSRRWSTPPRFTVAA